VTSLSEFVAFLNLCEKKDLAEKIVEVFLNNSTEFNQFFEIANCFRVLKLFKKQFITMKHMLKVTENIHQFNETKFNLINLSRELLLHEEALFHLEYFFYFTKNPELYITKSEILWDLNEKEESYNLLRTIERECCLDEIQKARSEYNLGYCLLHQGKFREGIEKVIKNVRYKKGYDLNNYDIFHNKKELNLPFWDGKKQIDKLIVYVEAGIGDEIINVRFVKKLQQKGIKVIWYAVWHNNPLENGKLGVVEVFKNNDIPVITNLETIENLDEYHWTYSQYLPVDLQVEEKELWDGPYLKAKQIKLSDKKNIGIRWGGELIPSGRNFPLKKLWETLLPLKLDASFYSLQKHNFLKEIKDFPEIIDLEKELVNFEVLLNYINSMDLIITCDTSIAHAAAALGKKVAIFVPISSYYVWTHSTDKSPWYGDNVSIFRQEKNNDWDTPMQKLKQFLESEINLC
jgi:hypothetical protein